MAEAASLHHLIGNLRRVHRLVEAAAARRRAADPSPDDPYLGLYVSDEHVDAMLATPFPRPRSGPHAGPGEGPEVDRGLPGGGLGVLEGDPDVEEAADLAEANGADIRLRTLARRFGLDALDVDILLLVLLPEVDPRHERLYGYLNDDVSRRHATAGMLLDVLGLSPLDGEARRRVADEGPLVSGGLLRIAEEPGRGTLSRQVVVAGRVVSHLLGDGTLPGRLAPLLVEAVDLEGETVDLLAKSLVGPRPLVVLRDGVGSAATAVGASALQRALGVPALAADLRRLPGREAVADLVEALVLEARVTGRGLTVGPLEELAALDRTVLRTLVEAPVPRVLISRSGWDPDWGSTIPLLLDAPQLDVEERAAIWREAISAVTVPGAVAVDPAVATVAFRLDPEQIHRAARAAGLSAAVHARPIGEAELRAGARAQNAVGLERLALRIEPQATWADLVVSPDVAVGLREIAVRSRHREVVLGAWGMGAGAGRGRGVTALFAGPSGTGKTLAAEVVAGDLGLDLYVIDLSGVIDKYIGETEKNLDRVFDEADRVNGVLLFDEADALFGKRSDVSDAHDRHANVEVAYLLQRMEQFDGIALLTTNLRANIDVAFTRRLDAIVEFPEPDEAQRRALWAHHVSRSGMPVADDIDLDFLAERFTVAGGEIHNIAVTAAYMAADRQGPVRMIDLVRATAREYRKLGRLTVETEFGSFIDALHPDDASDTDPEER